MGHPVPEEPRIPGCLPPADSDPRPPSRAVGEHSVSDGEVLCTVRAMGTIINEILGDVLGINIDFYEKVDFFSLKPREGEVE